MALSFLARSLLQLALAGASLRAGARCHLLARLIRVAMAQLLAVEHHTAPGSLAPGIYAGHDSQSNAR